MSLLTIIIIVGLSGAIFGVKKPWLGGISGLIFFSLLLYLFISTKLLFLILAALIGFLIGCGTGFVSSFIFSGFKGKGHSRGPSYMGGFGGGRGGAPPGGIILSDEERKNIRKR
jgi:hypothetical protein